MRRAAVGQLIHGVKLLCAQGHSRRIDDYICIAVRLHEPFAAYSVLLAVLLHKCRSVLLFIRRCLFIAFYKLIIIHFVKAARHVAGAGYICDILYVQPACKRVRNLDYASFTHSVQKKVRARIAQYAAPDLILPVIIMGKAPKARLYAAYYHGYVLIRLPAPV